VILHCFELPTLCIDDSSKVTNPTQFWGTMIFDTHDRLDMLTIILFSPWGSFDCVKDVIRVVDEDDTSCVVPKVQVWACKPMFPS